MKRRDGNDPLAKLPDALLEIAAVPLDPAAGTHRLVKSLTDRLDASTELIGRLTAALQEANGLVQWWREFWAQEAEATRSALAISDRFEDLYRRSKRRNVRLQAQLDQAQARVAELEGTP